MSVDAVLAYHTALEFHGKAYSVYTRVQYPFRAQVASIEVSDRMSSRGVPVPHLLLEKGQESFGVVSHKRSGVELRVTNLERTFVDVLDRPDLTGSWEEIWRSEPLNSSTWIRSSNTFFCWRMRPPPQRWDSFWNSTRKPLMVDDAHLHLLRSCAHAIRIISVRGKRKGCQWVKDWNLMIPVEILDRSWGKCCEILAVGSIAGRRSHRFQSGDGRESAPSAESAESAELPPVSQRQMGLEGWHGLEHVYARPPPDCPWISTSITSGRWIAGNAGGKAQDRTGRRKRCFPGKGSPPKESRMNTREENGG